MLHYASAEFYDKITEHPSYLGVKRMLALQRGLVIGHGLHTNNTFIL
jgi:hypothetical protein